MAMNTAYNTLNIQKKIEIILGRVLMGEHLILFSQLYGETLASDLE